MDIRVNHWKATSAILLGCVLVGAAGCGEEQQPPRAALTTGEVIRGSVYVTASNEAEAKKLADTLAGKLAGLGFPVVTSGEAEHELVARVDVALRETSGLLKVYVNGQPKRSYRAHAALRFMGGERMLSEESIDYDVDDGASEEQLRTLVAVARSASVQRYLTENRQRASSEVARRESEKEDAADALQEQRLAAKREQRRQEEAAWARVILSECSSPTHLTGCDEVKSYLASYPSGAHAADAKQSLEAGAPQLAKLADDRDWRAGRPEACAAPKTSTDCDGVTGYLSAEPAGAHLEEARALLVKAEPKLAAIRKAEEQRTRQEDAKADREAEQATKDEKRRALEQCKKETCLGGMCFNVRPGAFEICMDRCVKANCE